MTLALCSQAYLPAFIDDGGCKQDAEQQNWKVHNPIAECSSTVRAFRSGHTNGRSWQRGATLDSAIPMCQEGIGFGERLEAHPPTDRPRSAIILTKSRSESL